MYKSVQCTGKTQIFAWLSRSKTDELSIDDKFCSDGPSTARTEKDVEIIFEIILKDRRRTIAEIVELSRVKKTHQVKSNVTTIMISFFYVTGVVYSKFVQQDKRINQVFYLKVMKSDLLTLLKWRKI